MKNRTLIGIICMVLAVVMTFLVAPLVNRLTSDTVIVPRLVADVARGTQITETQLEAVQVKKDSLPSGVLNGAEKIIGKYAASDLYAGDYLTEAKFSGNSTSAMDVLATLNGTKVAMSVTIDTFSAGLSGKLQNSDVISFIITEKDTGKATIPPELCYVKVITTTTPGGIDQDSVVKNEDGSYEIPSTVTVLVNAEQAKQLAEYESGDRICAALVYRGAAENANKFLAKQDAYFTEHSDATTADETGVTANE